MAQTLQTLQDIHSRLRQARADAGYATAEEAATKLGWNPNTYRAHENGQRGIKPRIASKYAGAFRVNVVWLTHGEGVAYTPVNNEEQALIARFRALDASGRKHILDTIGYLISRTPTEPTITRLPRNA